MQLTTKWDIVKMYRELNGRNLAPDVELFYSCSEIRHRWMGRIISAHNVDSLSHTIGPVNIVNYGKVSDLIVLLKLYLSHWSG